MNLRRPFALLAAVLAWSATAAPDPSVARIAEAPEKGLVFTGHAFADFRWDPAQYPGTGRFLRWELLRGVSGGEMSRIRVSLDPSERFVRDQGLIPGTTYSYRMNVIRCSNEDCASESEIYFWNASATPGKLSGWLFESYEPPPGTHTVGVIVVQPSATFRAGPGVRLEAEGSSSIIAESTHMELEGAAVVHVDIWFKSSSGFVRGCDFTESQAQFVQVVGSSADIEISANKWSDGFGTCGYVYVWDEATATVKDNRVGEVSVGVDGDASAIVQNNAVLSAGSAGNSTLVFEKNTVSRALSAFGTSTTTARDNDFLTWPETTNYRRIYAWNTAELIFERNAVDGGDIYLHDESFARIADNVITGDSTLTIFETARGVIERTTLHNAVGVKVYGGALGDQLVFRHNCFENNQFGMQVQARTQPLDARQNWWGHESGPQHATNPGGLGLAISGTDVDFSNWDQTNQYCRDVPPGATTEPGAIELQADPSSLLPRETERYTPVRTTSIVTAWVTDDGGKPVAGTEVDFSRAPALGGFLEGTTESSTMTCTTNQEGRCGVVYQVPTAQLVWDGSRAAKEVVITATAGSVSGEETIAFEFMKVTQSSPPHDTRNVEWKSLDLVATFDREIDPATMTPDTFEVHTLWHDHAFDCMIGAEATSGDCEVVWNTENEHRAGLRFTGRLNAGPSGVRGHFGEMLQAPYEWKFATVPELEPTIVPVQVVDGVDLVEGKPGVVRIHAGLDEESELDWVDVRVRVGYDQGLVTRWKTHRYYPDPQAPRGAPDRAFEHGNACIFSSQKHEAPIMEDYFGGQHHTIKADLEIDGPGVEAIRSYYPTLQALTRPPDGLLFPYNCAIYPIAPNLYLGNWSPPYPWTAGSSPPGFLQLPLVQRAGDTARTLLPIGKLGFRAIDTTAATGSPRQASQTIDQYYLRSWARMLDRRAAISGLGAVKMQILVVPREWMNTVNQGDPILHQVGHFSCVVAEDASPAALAHCIAHRYGLEDDVWGRRPYTRSYPILQGWSVEADRVVDDEMVSILGPDYSQPLMSSSLRRNPERRIWIDRDSYDRLSDEFNPNWWGASATSASTDTITVGGEIRLAGGSPQGTLDVLELPSRGAAFPAPSGDGDAELLLLGAGVTELSRAWFAPIFDDVGGGQYASFLLTVAAPPGVLGVELRYLGARLDTVTASAGAPTVQVTQPTGGTLTGTAQVSWNASDTDAGSELRYSVSLSADDGQTWEPVVLETSSTSLSLDTTDFANGQACRLRVVADDGFRSAEATSAAFRISNPPRVQWTWPPDGSSELPEAASVRAGFRDAMDESTLNQGTLWLRDDSGAPVAAEVSWDEDIRQVALTAEEGLSPGVEYTATVSGSVRDVSGLAMGQDFTWSFRLRPTMGGGCTGDCDGDGMVGAAELLRTFAIFGRALPLASCSAADSSGNGSVSYFELHQAIGNARNGCPGFTPQPTPSPTPATHTPTPTVPPQTPTPTPTRTPTPTPTPEVPMGINGRVTAGGAPAGGVGLELRWWNGAQWSTRSATTVTADGTYMFLGVPGLQSAEVYYVRYGPNSTDPQYVSVWYGPDITSWSGSGSLSGGDFDIGNVVLSGPQAGATVSLPATFSWQRRGIAGDDYRWLMFDPDSDDGWTTDGLGDVGSFTLHGLPEGAVNGHEYGWYVAVYAAADSYGVSFYHRRVTFAP